VDSVWVGLDTRFQVNDQVLLGARVVRDAAAVPDEALLGNNYDANSVDVSGLVAFSPLNWLDLGVSGSHAFLATRTVSDSAFGMTLDEAGAKEDRWFYPHGKGTYAGSINRLGVQVRASL